MAVPFAILLLVLAVAVSVPASSGLTCEGLAASPPAPLQVVPLPQSLQLKPFSMKCQEEAPGTVYNNGDFADGNGPRGAMNASHCCAICASTSNCNYWSFNVDPGEAVRTRGPRSCPLHPFPSGAR